MPAVTIKAESNTDPRIEEISFSEFSAIYAIEILPSKQGKHSHIQELIQLLIKTTNRDGDSTAFEVDFQSAEKVKIVGNISEAMTAIQKYKEEMDLFSEKLFSDIDNNKAIQEILVKCSVHYAEINKDLESAPQHQISIKDKPISFKPKSETKEHNTTDNNTKTTSSTMPFSQGKTKS